MRQKEIQEFRDGIHKMSTEDLHSLFYNIIRDVLPNTDPNKDYRDIANKECMYSLVDEFFYRIKRNKKY
mgnify:CR=1 FL=1